MDSNKMNSDVCQFLHKIEAIIKTKNPDETKNFLFNQILSLANKLSLLESDCEKMRIALEAKDDLIEEYQSVIKESTVKFNQLQSYNIKLTKDKQRHETETDTLLMALSDIRDEVEHIEANYKEDITDKLNQISVLTEQINGVVLEKNELIQTINDYHVISEKEKDELNLKIDRLVKEIEYFKERPLNEKGDGYKNSNHY